MKIAVSGKGGVGKTTIAAALALLMAERGKSVVAVDADPVANMAGALGIAPEQRRLIRPISEEKALIEERTGAKVSQYGQMFKLNPSVSDITAGYSVPHRGVSLLVLGAVERGGAGCACPESVLLRALVSDLVLYKNEALIMDMEAGVEHLGRATARAVDGMLIVVEPGQSSADCAQRIARMAAEAGIHTVFTAANKVRTPEERLFLESRLSIQPLAWIPYCEGFRTAEREGRAALDVLPSETRAALEDLLQRLEEHASNRAEQGAAAI